MNHRMLIALSVVLCWAKASAETAPGHHTLFSEPGLSEKLAACHPQLGALQAYDDMPFPEVSRQSAQRIFMAEKVTPVILPFDPKVFAPNRYAIYSVACTHEASAQCHYLSVMPTLGLPQYRVFGPLDLSCTAVAGSPMSHE